MARTILEYPRISSADVDGVFCTTILSSSTPHHTRRCLTMFWRGLLLHAWPPHAGRAWCASHHKREAGARHVHRRSVFSPRAPVIFRDCPDGRARAARVHSCDISTCRMGVLSTGESAGAPAMIAGFSARPRLPGTTSRREIRVLPRRHRRASLAVGRMRPEVPSGAGPFATGLGADVG
jgi:hypothetical protein